ncbi:MAG TPA: TolC family protein [Steroidobacteraceae bacterium]|nr:TolC family protein [Steroidobacteraceae bacterium]
MPERTTPPDRSFGPFLLRVPVAAALAAIGACASTPGPTIAPPPPVDSAPRAWAAPAVIDNRRALGMVATSETSLSADEVLAAALAFNPRMKLARAQRDLGQAGVIAARERVNPTLSLNPEHLISAAAGVSPWVLAVSLVWPMRTAGKRDLAIEQALAADDGAMLNAAAAVWSLRADARATVCAAEFAWARRSLAQEEAALRTDLVARLEKQAEAGVVSRYEVARARLDRDAATLRLNQADADVIAARHDVAALAGVPMSQVELREPADRCIKADGLHEVAPVEQLETRAIGSRLDLRAKLAEFRGADAAWRTEIAKRYPDLALGPGYMYDQGDRKVTFSLSFELPLHSHNAGGIAKARADRERVVAEAEVLEDTIAAEVGKAADQLAQARAQLAAAQALRRQGEALLDRDVERERAGELDRPAVLTSRIATLTARADELTAARAVADAAAALEAATQTPLSSPEFNTEAARALLQSQ